MERPTPNSPETPKRIHIITDEQYREQRARDRAAEALEADKESLRGWSPKKFCKRMWKHNLAEDVYRHKEYYRQLNIIRETENPYGNDEAADPRAFENVVKSTIERFDFEEDQDAAIRLKEGRGETRNKLENDDPRRQALIRIISDFAEGRILDIQTVQERMRTALQVSGAKLGENTTLLENFSDIAITIKDNIDAYRALGNLNDTLEIYLGNAVLGSATESHTDTIDRVVERISKIPILNILSHETVATATAAAIIGFTKLGQTTAASAFSVAGSAVFGATIGALRERSKFNRQIKQHLRDRVHRREPIHLADQRKEIHEANAYFETKGAETIIGELTDSLERYEAEGTEAALNNLVAILSESRARTHFEEYGFVSKKGVGTAGSEEQKGTTLDLIDYPDASQVAPLNDQIRILQSKITKQLRQRHQTDTIVQQRFPGDLDGELRVMKNVHLENLTKGEFGVAETYKRIEQLRSKTVRNKTAKKLLWGALISTTMQEGIAFLNPNKAGLVERAWDTMRGNPTNYAGQGTTLLEGVYEKLSGSVNASAEHFSGNMPAGEHAQFIFDNKKITVEASGPNTYSVTHEGQIIRGLQIDSKGHLAADSVQKLREAGFNITEQPQAEQVVKMKSVDSWLEQIKNGEGKKYGTSVQSVNRENFANVLVYDKPHFSWTNEGGVITGKIPLPDTNTPSGVNIHNDAWSLRDMRVILTVGENSADRVLEIPVKATSEGFVVEIPKDHPAASLFDGTGSSVRFKGMQVELGNPSGSSDNSKVYDIYARETKGLGVTEVKDKLAKGTQRTIQRLILHKQTQPGTFWFVNGFKTDYLGKTRRGPDPEEQIPQAENDPESTRQAEATDPETNTDSEQTTTNEQNSSDPDRLNPATEEERAQEAKRQAEEERARTEREEQERANRERKEKEEEDKRAEQQREEERIRNEEARKKREEEEKEQKRKERERKKQEADETERKQKEARERQEKQRQEEERKKKREEEDRARQAEQGRRQQEQAEAERARKQKEEEEKRNAEEAQRQREKAKSEQEKSDPEYLKWKGLITPLITPRGFRSNPPRSDVNVYAALEFLGLPDKPTRKELDKKYKTLVQANHPDKVSRWTDLQEIATENCKLLSEAYSEIVKTKFNNKK